MRGEKGEGEEREEMREKLSGGVEEVELSSLSVKRRRKIMEVT